MYTRGSFILLLIILGNLCFAQEKSNVIHVKSDSQGEMTFPFFKHNSYYLRVYKKVSGYSFQKKIDTNDIFVFLPIAGKKIGNSDNPNKSMLVIFRKIGDDVVIAFDNNRNLDFDDDSNALVITRGNANELISIRDGEKVFSFYLNLYEPKNLVSNSSRILPKETIKDFRATDQYFNVRFNNVRYGIFEKKYIVGIYDANFDGIYDQPEKDRFFVASAKRVDLNFEESSPLGFGYSSLDIIKLDSSCFEIDSISKYGEHIYMKPYKGVTNNQSLIPTVLPDVIPKIDFISIDGANLAVNNYLERGKYVLIERWGTWCAGCIQQQPLISEIFNNYGSKINLISLNGKDNDIINVRKYISDNNMTWVNGFENEETRINLFRTSGYPSYILLDDKGEIIIKTIDVGEIIVFLKKEIK
ncbi:TlpA family protein disulfide reductase [Pedobacter frigiditerrae]|uniref:TlpA family protein disulfide reductase n=1 Tax=Pedobacter frigiditerrae TaxID=2530452 RepID=A0A4R0MTG2_9SPHI|nr:TlpA disulfide reductase family protein [Pedobacter frigiditerrae]TCC90361.1 TlpA family protein disulfide reductase [Pedobacter frigiditerrae]